jgi:hypothetical protein
MTFSEWSVSQMTTTRNHQKFLSIKDILAYRIYDTNVNKNVEYEAASIGITISISRLISLLSQDRR